MRIVVLTGKDSFMRVERSRQLQEALEAQFGSVDRFELDGASCSLSAVLDELRSYGLLSQHKLVVVDNAEAFMGAEDRRRAAEAAVQARRGEGGLERGRRGRTGCSWRRRRCGGNE